MASNNQVEAAIPHLSRRWTVCETGFKSWTTGRGNFGLIRSSEAALKRCEKWPQLLASYFWLLASP